MKPLGCRRNFHPVLPALAAIALLSGCNKRPVTGPASDAAFVNTVKPNANDAIQSQVLVGAAGQRTSLGTVRRDESDGTFGFIGLYNGAYCFGKMERSGNVRWATPASGVVMDVLPISAGLLVVSSEDTNLDGKFDVGRVALYTQEGILTSQATTSAGRWLNRIVSLTETRFVACGADRSSGTTRPFLFPVELISSASLAYGPAQTLDELDGPAVDIAHAPEYLYLYANLAIVTRDHGLPTIHSLTADWPSFGPVTLNWSRTVVAPCGAWDDGWSLHWFDAIYLAGSASDETRPGDDRGSRWSSGVVASYSANGGLQWNQVVQLSPYNDRFFSIDAGPYGLFALGQTANFVHQGNKEFGYGLVTRLDPEDGHVISNATFGNESYSSGFFGGASYNGTLFCAGWTLGDLTTGPYRGWLATVDPNKAGTTAMVRGSVDPEARAGRIDGAGDTARLRAR